MPDLVPVEHDPFRLMPVDHDPFAHHLVPVDHDPFAHHLVPVDHDPFEARGVIPFLDAVGQAIGRSINRGVESFRTLPERVMGASETLRETGEYDPRAPVEAAELLMGGPGLVSRVPARAGEAVLGAGPWTREKVDALHRLVGEGKKYPDIADELGVSFGAVVGKAKREGLAGEALRWSEEHIAQVRAMSEQGSTVSEIAEAVGRHPEAVRTFMKDRGIPINPVLGAERHELVDKVREMVRSGTSSSEIAKKLDLTLNQVNGIKSRMQAPALRAQKSGAKLLDEPPLVQLRRAADVEGSRVRLPSGREVVMDRARARRLLEHYDALDKPALKEQFWQLVDDMVPDAARPPTHVLPPDWELNNPAMPLRKIPQDMKLDVSVSPHRHAFGEAGDTLMTLSDSTGRVQYRANMRAHVAPDGTKLFTIGNIGKEGSATGLGPAMYVELAREAEKAGGKLVTSGETSQEAQRVYRQLEQLGYAREIGRKNDLFRYYEVSSTPKSRI